MATSEAVKELRRVSRMFMEQVPHNRALGITIDELLEGSAKMSLPYSQNIVGNPATGVIHGGAITTLMDACCGAAVIMKLTQPMGIATLDLRIDYLKPATPELTVVARATCYKLTRNVAFARCVAYHHDPDDPIASVAGAFALGTRIS